MLALVPPRSTTPPRRVTGRLLLQEEPARCVRPPRLADVREREGKDGGKDEEQSPWRREHASSELPECVAVRHEGDQHQGKAPGKGESRAVGRPTERCPP